MWLVHAETGVRVLLAKDFGYGWRAVDADGQTAVGVADRLDAGFVSQHNLQGCPAFAPTDWTLEFEVER